MKNSFQTAILGISGGGIVGAAIWGATELFDISPLLAWIIVGAAVGGFEATAWMIMKRQFKAGSTQYSPTEEY